MTNNYKDWAKLIFCAAFISNFAGKTKSFSSLLKLKGEEEFVWEYAHQHDFDQIKSNFDQTTSVDISKAKPVIKIVHVII